MNLKPPLTSALDAVEPAGLRGLLIPEYTTVSSGEGASVSSTISVVSVILFGFLRSCKKQKSSCEKGSTLPVTLWRPADHDGAYTFWVVGISSLVLWRKSLHHGWRAVLRPWKSVTQSQAPRRRLRWQRWQAVDPPGEGAKGGTTVGYPAIHAIWKIWLQCQRLLLVASEWRPCGGTATTTLLVLVGLLPLAARAPEGVPPEREQPQVPVGLLGLGRASMGGNLSMASNGTPCCGP